MLTKQACIPLLADTIAIIRLLLLSISALYRRWLGLAACQDRGGRNSFVFSSIFGF